MIRAQALTRRFGDYVAVDGVSLSVQPGAILAVLGPNGAGKTTTVRMLAGLLAPTSGEATVAGCDVRSHPAAVRAHVGLVTDSPGLHDQMTPAAYLDFFGRVYGLDTAARRRRVDELLDLFDLEQFRATRMAGFSRGMQQKVALARALLHQPEVLFLDEPTAGLDPLAARSVRALVRGLRDARRTIVLCTHDLEEAERLADTVAILSHGRILACDTSQGLRRDASADTMVHVALARPFPEALAIAVRVAGAREPRLESPLVLAYVTSRPDQVNPVVVSSLAAAGAAIVSVSSMMTSLEDAYASLVGEAAGAARHVP